MDAFLILITCIPIHLHQQNKINTLNTIKNDIKFFVLKCVVLYHSTNGNLFHVNTSSTADRNVELHLN